MTVQPATLIEWADKIDRRLGPISGRDADRLAVLLRAAAEQLAGIRHPTGSEQFAAALADLAVPAPWRLCDEEIGAALAANGAFAFQTDVNREQPDEAASALAMWIICAVNTLAGFKAECQR